MPFLGAGYGTDADAWRMINAGREMAHTGEYVASRLPGYPLPEFVDSLLWNHGPLAANGLTSLLGALAVVFFALMLKSLRCDDYLLGAFALGMIPVIYIASTTSMDYIWALTFITASLYFAIRQRPLASGLLLGLATACRITSVCMLLPASLFLDVPAPRRGRALVLLSASALAVGALAFVPVFARYGNAFFSFSDTYPPWRKVIYNLSFGVWGGLGLVVLLIAFHGILRARRRGPEQTPSLVALPVRMRSGALLAVALYGLLFLRLPHEAAYLIPTLPFIVILMASTLPRRHFQAVCLVIVMSPFLLAVDKGGIHVPGPILVDHVHRQREAALIEAAVARAGRTPRDKRVIVAGWYLPHIETVLGSDNAGGTRYVYLLSSTEVDRYLASGYELVYLPGQRDFERQVHGVDLARVGVPLYRNVLP